MPQPTKDELICTLTDAGTTHHDYEQIALGGKRDEMWPGFYAAHVLGRLDNFVAASMLSAWLEEAPATDHGPLSTADYILERLKG